MDLTNTCLALNRYDTSNYNRRKFQREINQNGRSSFSFYEIFFTIN